MIRVFVCGFMACARLIELGLSRRNIEMQRDAREGELSRASFPLMVALHSTVIGLTLLRGRRLPNRSCLALLVLVQPLRWWVLRTLGSSWNARGAVSETLEVVTGGPYAYVRHPNYSIVAVELAALPAAFGLGRLAVVASLVNAVLLTVRVREEERMLFEVPGYAEHFKAMPRFIPFLI